MTKSRLGEPEAGVRTVEQSSAGGLPGVGVETQAVLEIEVTPLGRGSTIITAKIRVAEAPAARLGSVRVQVEPCELSGVQVHPEELEPALKLVLVGTVSTKSRGSAARLPVFCTVRSYTSKDPGVPGPVTRVFVRDRFGVPGVRGVTSVAVLSAGSSAALEEMVMVLTVCVTLAGRMGTTVTAKAREAEPPETRAPKERVQVDPAEELGLQVHPGELAAVLKVVWLGTVSERMTPGALAGPELEKLMV